MRPRALVLAPMRGPAWARLRELADVIYEPVPPRRPFRTQPAKELAARLAAEHARILITEADEVNGPVLDLPLMVIGCTRPEPVNVDVAAATARGIPVLCAPGRDADGVAELTLALLLAVGRRLLVADRDARTGRAHEEREPHRSWELAGRTFGIVGSGPSVRAVTWRVKGLGMRVIAHGPDSPKGRHGLDRLLAEADVVSVHGAGGSLVDTDAGTIMGAAEFAAMKPGSIFINTGRADLHDMDALTGALKAGHLGGAALDHAPEEPDHPLAGMDNVLLTLRIGDATYDTEVNHTRMICGDIVRLLGGEPPLHCVNPEVLRA